MPSKYTHNADNSITIVVDKKLKEQAKERAEKEGRTLSNYVRYLIQKDIIENK